MNMSRLSALALAASAAVAVTGCAYDDYGYGYDRPYYGSGYGSPYGYGGGYRSYGYGGSYGYAAPYSYGWYGDYYYPGVGVYIYGRTGTRHRWNGDQQRYWQSRRGHYRGGENWSTYRDSRGYYDRDDWQGRPYRRP
ncbi:MAG: hypothetical protein ABIP41_01485 [Croceibacterium sp.]